tara:strand:+ start:254 stop:898 length:645 start_codon:yes stop_codon:yes gene_type:complete
MFDYNFPEQLTMKRQIILLLSLVIPTDPDILKDIYKKKKELEIEEYHKEEISWRYILRSWRPNDKYRMLFTQINALYPDFIQYHYALDDNDFGGIYIHPLKEMYTEELVHPAPSGISVINHLFQNWGYYIDGSIFDAYDGTNDGNLKLIYNTNRHYIEFNEKIAKFRRCVELFKNSDYTGLENELDDVDDIEGIGDINWRLGIQVDFHRRIVCN